MSNATKPQAASNAKPTLPPTAPIAAALVYLQGGQWTPEDFAAWDATRSASKTPGVLTVKHRNTPDKDGKLPTGTVSVYGLNSQYPVSLYPEQWFRLFGFREQIEAYINTNRQELDALAVASKAAKEAAKNGK